MKALAREKIFPALLLVAPPSVKPSRTLRYIGGVMRATNERLLAKMEKLVEAAPHEEIFLFVTSTGGPTGTAMSFYDTVQHVIKPSLTTLGSGDVDSSGIIIFLAGERRFISARTTLLFHPAGRRFGTERYTTREMEAMLAEDRLKDAQYAGLVALRSRGNLTSEQVLEMMERHTVLSPHDLVRYGLADSILD
jgi:ATP-dependent protease ClpP protease subunit